MADSPPVELHFRGTCPDCGVREVRLPAALPGVGDDFDWLVRDYDGFRLFMLEELAARFPERRRWTPADLEVVLVDGKSIAAEFTEYGCARKVGAMVVLLLFAVPGGISEAVEAVR